MLCAKTTWQSIPSELDPHRPRSPFIPPSTALTDLHSGHRHQRAFPAFSPSSSDMRFRPATAPRKIDPITGPHVAPGARAVLISVVCPGCGETYKVHETLRGKSMRCLRTTCRRVFTIDDRP